MFRGLFGKHHDEEDEYFETIDPVVEQRRKEKFSTPLIYDEEFKREQMQEQQLERKAEKKVEPKKSKKEVVDTPTQAPTGPAKSGYQMMQVISPMRGVTNPKNKKSTEKPVTKPIRKRKSTDQLVQVISPYFGMFEEKVDIEEDIMLQTVSEEPAEVLKDTVETKTIEIKEKLPTVEDNLRNIAKIVEEEKDQLKIIEERTGEFKLDFGETKKEKPTTLIDEIDDDMSLDELMSLYEKKFTD